METALENVSIHRKLALDMDGYSLPRSKYKGPKEGPRVISVQSKTKESSNAGAAGKETGKNEAKYALPVGTPASYLPDGTQPKPMPGPTTESSSRFSFDRKDKQVRLDELALHLATCNALDAESNTVNFM